MTATWRLTHDVSEYAARVWQLLAADPARWTIALSVIESLRAGGRFPPGTALMGWCEEAGEARGAVCMTPPYELLVAAAPARLIPGLVAALRGAGVDVPGVNAQTADADRFAAAWTTGTTLGTRVVLDLRLYRLAALRVPVTSPPGRARAASERDLELGVRWFDAFEAEADAHRTDVEPMVRERIADGRLWLWEDESGEAVSLAARTAPAVGVTRVAPVYTPPERRGRGYGTAVTTACTQDALRRGAAAVVLFTDLANPTSNRIYQQIGFRPLTDFRVIRFDSEAAELSPG